MGGFITSDSTFIWPSSRGKRRKRYHFLTAPIDDAGIGVRLHIFENGVFRRGGEDIARRIANGLLGNTSRPERLESVIALLKEGSKVQRQDLNPAALDLLNVQNGMLEWRTGLIKPHSPEHRSTFQISAKFLEGTRSAVLDKFLSDVFPKDALQLAEEMVGYLLRPTPKLQKAFILLGEGSNGKSTFLSMLTTFLGEDSVSNVSLHDLVENRFAIAELDGKLANIYADLPSSSLEKSDVFKAIVGGDTVKAERKFGQPFKLAPTARLIFSANELPRSMDLSHGYFRRWVIIPFPNRFEGSKAKKDLIDSLKAPEIRSALLNRALAGLRRLETNQEFTQCASVQQAGQSYRRQCDSAYEFITECLELQPGSSLGKTEVYEGFQRWLADAGLPQRSNQRALNKRLAEVLSVVEGRISGKRVWMGLAWKEDAPGEEAANAFGPQSGAGTFQ